MDSNWVDDVDRRRSTSAYVFTLSCGTISWMSKKQVIVTLSTTEVEYVASIEVAKEMIWL